jgi:hypothetical protein
LCLSGKVLSNINCYMKKDDISVDTCWWWLKFWTSFWKLARVALNLSLRVSLWEYILLYSNIFYFIGFSMPSHKLWIKQNSSRPGEHFLKSSGWELYSFFNW